MTLSVPATLQVEIPDQIPGPQGEQGIQGEIGAQGPQGDVGTVGPQGIPGQDGAPGANGADGSDGETGSQGPQGVPGDVGPIGPAGSSAGARTVITTTPAYPADAKAIIQAGLNTADANRGGQVILVESRSKILSGLSSAVQGLDFTGEGMPGIDASGIVAVLGHITAAAISTSRPSRSTA